MESRPQMEARGRCEEETLLEMSLPWQMSEAAWAIFKLNPRGWEEDVAAGKLVLLPDGRLEVPGEQQKEQQIIDELKSWVAQPVFYFDGERNRVWTGASKGDDTVRRRKRVEHEPRVPLLPLSAAEKLTNRNSLLDYVRSQGGTIRFTHTESCAECDLDNECDNLDCIIVCSWGCSECRLEWVAEENDWLFSNSNQKRNEVDDART